jgi:hypothetical protein
VGEYEKGEAMQFDSADDFAQNIAKLLTMLKGMVKNKSIYNAKLSEFLGKQFGKSDVNVNLCFFTFMPMPFDEMEEDEIEEFMESHVANFEHGQENFSATDLNFELNSQDIEFLKRHGLKF